MAFITINCQFTVGNIQFETKVWLGALKKDLKRDTGLSEFAHGRWVVDCPTQLNPYLDFHLLFNLVSGVCLKRTFKVQFRKAFLRSKVHPSRKLWPNPISGNSAPCILPCKIGGL